MHKPAAAAPVIQRINDDHKLRPFLSIHFDSQEYVKNIINNNQAEESLVDINHCINDVNDEIKQYIASNKDSLMYGMSDVATLAERYHALSNTSNTIHDTISRLKDEINNSYNSIEGQAKRLEKLHATSLLLRQLRQFVNAKTQLDYQLKDENIDIRHLASAAKYLNELESLLTEKSLVEVTIVKEQITFIKKFGVSLRTQAQEGLIVALKDRNQANVGAALQIFFNLQSLSEIIMYALDAIIKQIVDASNTLLDFDGLTNAHPDIFQPSGNRSKSNISDASTSTTPQLRVAMREVAHMWSTKVLDLVMQVHVLSRVINKKEDPVTHKKLLEILEASPLFQRINSANGSNNKLFTIFWDRLAVTLVDTIATKLKRNPIVSVRMYPYLRNASTDVLDNISTLAMRDYTRDAQSNMTVAPTGAHNPYRATEHQLFGSLFQNNLLFGSLSMTRPLSLLSSYGMASSTNASSKVDHTARKKQLSIEFASTDSSTNATETGLLLGLKPLKDKYISSSLQRMTAPILQMFPSNDNIGYNNIPSKVDLRSLLKAISNELVVTCLEGDKTLVMYVCKEITKVITLFCNKVEGLIIYDSNKINIINETNNASSVSYIKNSEQEHNSQLITLMINLRETLEKLPYNVIKLSKEMPGSVFSNESINGDTYALEIQGYLNDCALSGINAVDDLTSTHLLQPLVNTLCNYVKSSSFVALNKEGVSSSTTNVESSRAMQALTSNIPTIVHTYIASLGSSKNELLVIATEEFLLRIVSIFISVCCMLRPMTEVMKLRITADITALESTVNSIMMRNATNATDNENPVIIELKSLRRLLFIEDEKALSKLKIQSLPYLNTLRPSTLLGFLIAIAPPQLPLPYEQDSASVNLLTYLDVIFPTSSNTRNNPDMNNILSIYVRPNSSNGVYTSWPIGEMKAWEYVKMSLDKYMARIAIMKDKTAKTTNREHYELVLDIGAMYF